MMFPGLEIFTKRGDNDLHHQTPLQVQRAKQIETLHIFNQHVIEVNKDVKYRVGFTAASQNFTLLVILPPQFPQQKAVVSIWPPVRHPWVHPQNLEITECPGLNKFTMHSDLGHVINTIIQEFQSRPPVLISSNNAHGPLALVRSSSRPRSYSHGSEMSNDETQSSSKPLEFKIHKSISNQLSSSHPTLSSNPHSSLELSSLSLKELKKLNEDDKSLTKFIHKLPKFRDVKDTFESLLLENKQLAKENLEREPELGEMKKSLIEKFEIAGTLQCQFEQHLEKHRVLSEAFSPPSIRDRLHTAAVRTEDESESTAEQFCAGQLPVDEFLKRYMKIKTLSYHQKAREEKLSQQLKELNKTWY